MYWVTISKVQGSNLSLTTNLLPCFGLCSVGHPQICSKFPILALKQTLYNRVNTSFLAKHSKITFYNDLLYASNQHYHDD